MFRCQFFVSACSPLHIRTRILYKEQISFCYHPISGFGLKETNTTRHSPVSPTIASRVCPSESARRGGAFESAAKRSYCIRQVSHFAVSLTRPTKTFSNVCTRWALYRWRFCKMYYNSKKKIVQYIYCSTVFEIRYTACMSMIERYPSPPRDMTAIGLADEWTINTKRHRSYACSKGANKDPIKIINFDFGNVVVIVFCQLTGAKW